QELIIGPLAWNEARKVQGLQIVDEMKGEVVLQNGDPKNTIDRLVSQYERIFGKVSHAVCHDAVQDIIAKMSPEEIPSSLR
ncbi:hypothetical protein HZA26_00815, partial [Candidatus Nomurabacteria bacterium]|nr:hypothetical protein [Candidatus Nomurabacteria bacterium]